MKCCFALWSLVCRFTTNVKTVRVCMCVRARVRISMVVSA